MYSRCAKTVYVPFNAVPVLPHQTHTHTHSHTKRPVCGKRHQPAPPLLPFTFFSCVSVRWVCAPCDFHGCSVFQCSLDSLRRHIPTDSNETIPFRRGNAIIWCRVKQIHTYARFPLSFSHSLYSQNSHLNYGKNAAHGAPAQLSLSYKHEGGGGGAGIEWHRKACGNWIRHPTANTEHTDYNAMHDSSAVHTTSHKHWIILKK